MNKLNVKLPELPRHYRWRIKVYDKEIDIHLRKYKAFIFWTDIYSYYYRATVNVYHNSDPVQINQEILEKAEKIKAQLLLDLETKQKTNEIKRQLVR